MSTLYPQISAVILAGGKARRMGEVDKGLMQVDKRPMIQYVLEALYGQIDQIIINANRNQSTYESFGFPVISDTAEGFQGPLAGMATAMAYVNTEYILTMPCDSPFIPDDYVSRMYDTLLREASEIGVADNGERIQPVFSLIPTALLPSLEEFLSGGERKIDTWFFKHKLCKVSFSDKPDMFMNINTRDDIERVEAGLSGE